MIHSENIHLWLFTLVSLWLVSPGFASAQTCDKTFKGGANTLNDPLAWDEEVLPNSHNVVCFPNPDGAAALDTGMAANSTASIPGDPTAACCVGSQCQLATRSNCEAMGGFFADGVAFCSTGLCASGACCTGAPACVDDNGNGGSMTEAICGIVGGTYFGAAGCEFGDPCGLQRLPEGFEIIFIAPGSIGDVRGIPKINNCGQVTFAVALDGDSYGPATEIYFYDNGLVTPVTINDVSDAFPSINDDGTITWTRRLDFSIFSVDDVILLRSGKETLIGSGAGGGDINNAGHVVWSRFGEDEATHNQSTVMFYDGSVERAIYHDGFSNTSPQINESDEIAWDHSASSLSGAMLDIRRLTKGVLELFESGLPCCSQGADIDDIGRLVWSTYTDHRVIDLYQDGQITTILDGDFPALNNRGDIAYSFKTSNTPWQIWLLRNGERFWISSIRDKADIIDNKVPDMNDAGEITWMRVPNGQITPVDTMLMRRIRTGDVDLDNDVDELDLAYFPECFTGPTPTDGLCVCRFLDIDHDRDVDNDDFTLFMANYTGAINDCNGNGAPDTDDIFGGAVPDCNKNGVPDSCDIATGFSADADGDGLPDDCVCRNLDRPWKPVLYQRRGRYLSIIPETRGSRSPFGSASSMCRDSLSTPDRPAGSDLSESSRRKTAATPREQCSPRTSSASRTTTTSANTGWLMCTVAILLPTRGSTCRRSVLLAETTSAERPTTRRRLRRARPASAMSPGRSPTNPVIPESNRTSRISTRSC